MGFPKARLYAKDWRNIQDAVSNSDLPNEERVRLLDKIGTKLSEAEALEAAQKGAK